MLGPKHTLGKYDVMLCTSLTHPLCYRQRCSPPSGAAPPSLPLAYSEYDVRLSTPLCIPCVTGSDAAPPQELPPALAAAIGSPEFNDERKAAWLQWLGAYQERCVCLCCTVCLRVQQGALGRSAAVAGCLPRNVHLCLKRHCHARLQ